MKWLLVKRWRIILSGTLIVTVPIFGLALFVYIEISGHLVDIIDEENRQAALNIASHIEKSLKSDIRNGGLFTTRLLLKEAVRQRDRKNITRNLKTFVDHVSSVERAFVVDGKGILLADYPEDRVVIGKSFSYRDWYQGVSGNWEPYVSEFYLRVARPQKHLFAISLPIRDADNSVIGVLVLQASENYIQDAIAHIPAPKNQKVYVVDRKGSLIYHPDYRVDRIIDFTGFPSVRNVIHGQSGVETLKNPDGAAMLTAYRPVKQWGWGVIVQRPEQEVYASLRKLTYGLFAFTAVMIAIGALLAYRRSEALFSLKKLSRELETRVEERTTELTKANRVLKTLSECNQALVRIEDEDVLIKKLCRIITEYGGYRMALVGYPVQDENKTVKAVAQAGYEDDFLDTVSLTWADAEAGNGPIGTAIRSRDISLFKNIASDAYPAAWREAAQRRGYGSAMGLPLSAGKELMGALAIYSSDAFAFDEKEIKLLKELADDMAYGIMTIRRREAQKAAEEALRRSQELYHSTLDNMMEGCQIIGSDWRYLYINDAAEKHNRRPKEELLGRIMMDMWPGIEATEVFAAERRCMEERTAHHMENEFAFPDGASGWFDLSIQPVPDGIFILSIDITERKQNDLFIKNIFESMGEGLVVVDPQYRILAANKEYCRQVDLRLEEIVGRHCYEVFHHLDKQCAELGIECPSYLTFQSGRPYAAVHELKGEKGAPTYHEIKSYPIKDESGEVRSVIEIITDITEKRKLEAQYLHAQKMESVGTLAGGIAHDFNNILSAIIGYGHVALMKMAEDDPQRLNIESILEAADRAAHLTRDLLLFSRKQVSERRPADLNEVVRKVEKFLMRVIGEDIECKTMLRDGPLPVHADSHQLEQVLMNLATNARDAMPEGGAFTVMTEQVALHEDFIAAHGYGKPGSYAMITVSDTGTGMDEATRKHIFEPFFTTKEVGKGTGLGLAVVYGIIKQHDGFVNVYSEPGKGTTFRIYLPIIGSIAREETAARQEEAPAWGAETVLLAEDDDSLRKLARTVLTQYGYKIIEAIDGEDAVSKFRENRDAIQLLLFDLIMPKMNGKEAYDEIRKIKPDMKVIFASGYALDIIRQKAALEDGVRLIYKPIAPMELLRTVRSVLDGVD